MLTNNGNISLNHMGYLLIFLMKGHINELSMANILSLRRSNMETSKEKLIYVHTEDGKLSTSKHVHRVFSKPTLTNLP